MVAKSYYNAAHFGESFQMFNDLRESGSTCDIRLLASNKEISAHKIVLASASEYFKNAIYGLFLNDSGKGELELKEIQYEMLSAVINYTYTGKIEINSENVYDIYDAADYCLMNFLKEKCFEFLEENLEVDNCVKILLLAKNCKHDKLMTAAANFIFSNLQCASNTKEFMSLSEEEFSIFLKFWPKNELYDSIITSALKWAGYKENWEETVINILKDIPYTRISDDYLNTFLSKHEFIENSFDCNKWMMNIYKEKSKLHKLKRTELEAKLKIGTFLFEQPIIFMALGDSNNFYKYNRRDGALNLYKEIKAVNYLADDCKTYRNWMYVIGERCCERFAFDNLNKNGYESAFCHDHGRLLSAAILNDSMYIFGGLSSEKKCSVINLHTKQATSVRLLHNRKSAGVAVSDGSLYICGGFNTDVVERFDPREGRATDFGSITFDEASRFWAAATLPNELYCTNGKECKMMDLRINSKWLEIGTPCSEYFHCLFSSYGTLYGTTGFTLHKLKYNMFVQPRWWEDIASFPELSRVYRATSFE